MNSTNLALPMQILIEHFLRKTPFKYKLNAFDRIFIFILSSYMGNKCTCWPSLRSLIIDCGMSKDTVIRTIKRLETFKIITVKREKELNNIYSFSKEVVAHSYHLVADSDIKVVAHSDPNNNIFNNNINNHWVSKNSQKTKEQKQNAKFWEPGNPDYDRLHS